MVSSHLVQSVVQTLVEVFEVAQDDGLARFHGNLNEVDVPANLLILLVVRKARPEDDLRSAHVEQILKIKKA